MDHVLNHRSILILLIIAALLITACGSGPATQKSASSPAITPSMSASTPPATEPTNTPAPIQPARTPVVIDTDMSQDAIMAILYLLQRPGLSVEAITISGTGETHCGPGIAHARGLIALLNSGDIPVACGRETPLTGDHKFPADWRAAADSSLGITWPENIPETPNNQLTSVDLLQKTIKSAAHPVVVVTDGPLTNLAEAFQADPQLVDNVRMIYIMGGAIDVPGNIYGVPLRAPNKTAEFNIFIDPHAANLVLNAGAPITLVPLDATNQVPLDKIFYKLLSEHQDTAAAKTVYTMLTTTKIYDQGAYFWDPLTYAIASDESLAFYTTKKIAVIEEEGPEVGRTIDSQTGREVRAAMTVDADRFVETYLSTLNGGQKIAIDWVAVRAVPTSLLTATIYDGKCVLEGPKQVPAGEFGVKLIDKDPKKGATLAIVTLDAGKTFSDLDAFPSANPPPWVQVLEYGDANPGKETMQTAEVKEKPLYLVCLDWPPARKIGAFGPIEVIK